MSFTNLGGRYEPAQSGEANREAQKHKDDDYSGASDTWGGDQNTVKLMEDLRKLMKSEQFSGSALLFDCPVKNGMRNQKWNMMEKTSKKYMFIICW